MSHTHNFKKEEWPFDIPENTSAFCTRNILNENAPILTIIHDHDSEWQFLNGSDIKTGDIALVCLGCMFSGHKLISEFCDLPKGWVAWRTLSEDIWQYEELANENS